MTVRFWNTANAELWRPRPSTGGILQAFTFRWVVALLAVSLVLANHAHAASNKAKAGPRPALTVPIEALGYHPQSASFIVSRLSTNSLNFIDQDHLLLTFRTTGLMKRDEAPRPGDEDQSIHAVVLELPAGLVVRTADWRMHDHGRYLWPLHDGTFLVRQRDILSLTDASLELRPYIKAPAPLQAVQPSVDGKLLVMQFDKERHSATEHERLIQQARDADAPLPREDVSVVVIDATTAAVLARIEAGRAIYLPLMGNGYLEALPGKQDHFQLTYLSFAGERKVFGDVLSTCTPSEVAATPTVALLTTCHAKTEDHLVQALDIGGKLLWEAWWDNKQIWPSFANSADGSRFAISRLHASHGVDALDPIGDDDIKGQSLQVFDPMSGGVLLNLDLTSPVSASENFALSPDGKRFAALTPTAIEIYDVPPPGPPPAESKKRK